MKQQHTFMPRFFSFMQESYEPGLHFGFAALWFLGLNGALLCTTTTPLPWIINLKTLLATLTLFFVLFILRCVDEIKDFEYDKIHNPDRPLVVGVVTENDLFAFCMLATALIVVFNLCLSSTLLAIALFDVLYGIYLIWVERISAKVSNSLFYSLLVTYPVNVLLSVYTLLFFMREYGVSFSGSQLWIILAFALAFLHYEFSRKNAWPQHAQPGQRLYSETLTPQGTLLLSNLCAFSAPCIVFVITKPWLASRTIFFAGVLLMLPYLFTVIGTIRFIGARNKPHQTKKVLMPFATIYLVLFYLTLIIYGGITRPIEFGLF